MSLTGVAFLVSGANEVKTKGTDITTIAQEFYYNAITGNVDIDAEWDNYQGLKKQACRKFLNLKDSN